MLVGEKSFYKEINNAPEIKFPIKVDIALPAHKISLLIQAELGNVALPDGENHRKHHHQYRIDKSSVFTHANRLIRCIVDCQVQLQDAVSARHALELGRSLAAHVWDNTASQLRQVEGLGEVAVRKLAAASINSIDTLLNTEPSRIEVVLGKNPPFGHQLLKKLEAFPNLRISVKETSREIHAGQGATVTMTAEIGFLNDILPTKFNKKTFSVCFLVEDSNGSLLEFRRFGTKKLDGGERVPLTLRLTSPTTHARCYVMCDSIAGTSRYAELDLSGIPPSIYPEQPHINNAPSCGINGQHDVHGAIVSDDDFDDCGIQDDDLLAICADSSKIEVVEDIDAILQNDDSKAKVPKHDDDDDSHRTTYREPSRLPNGRWTCQHDCNERDKKCKHKCCHEGVVKPKRKSTAQHGQKEEELSQRKITALASMRPKLKSGQASEFRTGSKIKHELSDLSPTESVVERPAKRTKNVESTLKKPSHNLFDQEGRGQKPAAKRSTLPKDELSDFWGTELDVGFESDAPSRPGKNMRPSDQKVRTIKEESPSLFDHDDHMFDLSWFDDEPSPNQTPSTEDAPPFKDSGSTLESEMLGEEQCAAEEDHFDFLDTEMDLGGFEPPVMHVNLSDVLKKGKNSPEGPPSTAAENIESFGNVASRVIDVLDDVADSVGLLGDQEKMGHDLPCSPDAAEATFVESPAETPVDLLVKTPGDAEAQTPGHDRGVTEGATVSQETAEERKDRLYEEDQKQKWEGIDRWIFDEFHEYVELV